jgi:hypothetical protein
MAWSAPFFQRPGAVLVGAHDAQVNHRVFVICVLGQMREQLLPHAAFGPTPEPCVHDAEITEALR